MIGIDYQAAAAAITNSKPFKRLDDKTQVHLRHAENDHVATRGSHTRGVTMMVRKKARRLGLNEDLSEVMGLGHDVGHGPFGHIGEATLNELSYSIGFKHSKNSVRILEELEAADPQVKFDEFVKNGVLHHSKGRGNFFETGGDELLTPEAHLVRLADVFDYVRSDYQDALRLELVPLNERPTAALAVLGRDPNTWESLFCDDVVTETLRQGSWRPTASPVIAEAVVGLRDWLFDYIYRPLNSTPQSEAAANVIRFLVRYYTENPHEIQNDQAEHPRQAAIRWVSGMTDTYALNEAERLSPGSSEDVVRLPVMLPPRPEDFLGPSW